MPTITPLAAADLRETWVQAQVSRHPHLPESEVRAAAEGQFADWKSSHSPTAARLFSLQHLEHVTRLNVIPVIAPAQPGENFHSEPISDVRVAVQDDGRTLKVFYRPQRN